MAPDTRVSTRSWRGMKNGMKSWGLIIETISFQLNLSIPRPGHGWVDGDGEGGQANKAAPPVVSLLPVSDLDKRHTEFSVGVAWCHTRWFLYPSLVYQQFQSYSSLKPSVTMTTAFRKCRKKGYPHSGADCLWAKQIFVLVRLRIWTYRI